jgi:hypothetical protein
MAIIQVGIYDCTRLISVIEAESHVAWPLAASEVRRLSNRDIPLARGKWFRTANNHGYERGNYRAIAMRAPNHGCKPFCEVL